MSEVRRIMPLPLGGEHGLPYSRGLMARALMAVGVPADRAYALARTVGHDLASRNSEVVHAGIYYPSGTLKAELCVEGKASLYAHCRSRDIPHLACGKLVVAASPAEAAFLERLENQARANGVDDCTIIDRGGLKRLEPEIGFIGEF